MQITQCTLNSSLISLTNELICFINRSTDASAPVFNNVVIASVAMDRFVSVINCSKSTLHEITACG